MPSIKKNFAYSSILSVAGYLFPLITFPYVSRVLGVNNIGIYNFIESIINYYILFSMMGMATVGVREIAANQYNRLQLSKTYSSLLTLNMITTTIAAIVLLITAFLVPKFYEQKYMMFVGLGKLLFFVLTIEWFFKGIENFKYITVRSLFVRTLYVISVFIFVRNQNDYIIYFILQVVMLCVNAIINLVYSSKYVKFSIKDITFKPYIKPFITLGVYGILTSMYTSFNVAFLGFVANNTEVGYYTTATKLFTIILSLFTAFTAVMLPRMSSLAANGNMDEFKILAKKSIITLLFFAIPCIVIMEIFTPELIYIIAGDGYNGAIKPMRLVMPLMLIIGLEQILVIQILMPLKKDKAILVNSIIGAFVGIILNLVLVPSLKSVGSSVVWIVSELVVLIFSQLFVFYYIHYLLPLKPIVIRILGSIPIFIVCVILKLLISNIILTFILGCVLVFFYILFAERVLYKDDFILSNMNFYFNKMLKNFKFIA